MQDDPSSFISPDDGEKQWYDLFSRGARDWLRHNDKVSEAVRKKLPEIIANLDVLGPRSPSTLRIPVTFLEHYRFRLRGDDEAVGAGQGQGKPGDTLVSPSPSKDGGPGEGGNNEGGYQFVLELKTDDIVDWLWEELKLPHLKRKEGSVSEADYRREGWNRRGVRSRLDRRRSIKEAIKRGPRPGESLSLTDDDLRFRQLVMRRQPATEAVVFFCMDVSSSMTDEDRRLAKTFFFWVVQGLRRQYTNVELVFVAHTVEAWEFNEEEFFKVTGSGGTIASTAFNKTLEVLSERFDPGRFNLYLFYASDGANFSSDTEDARAALERIGALANFAGYVETQRGSPSPSRSETGKIFDALEAEELPVGSYLLRDADTVWDAIRAFFTEQSAAGADGA